MKKTMKPATRRLVITAAVLVVLAVLAIILAPQIVQLFLKDNPEVTRIGALTLRLQCICVPLFSFTCLANMMLQTLGIAGKATLLAASRQGLFFIPTVLGLEMLLGLTGVQMAQAIADVLSFLLAVPLAFSVLNMLKQKELEAAR